MKNGLSRACLLLLGITLAVGCGPAAPDDMQEPTSSEPQTVLEEAAPEEGEQVSQDGTSEEEGNVGALSACCFVKCRGDTAFRGPFKSVRYGACGEYGRYYCAQRRLGFERVKWDDCKC